MWDKKRKPSTPASKAPTVKMPKVEIPAAPSADPALDKIEAALKSADALEEKEKKATKTKVEQDEKYNQWGSCRC